MSFLQSEGRRETTENNVVKEAILYSTTYSTSSQHCNCGLCVLFCGASFLLDRNLCLGFRNFTVTCQTWREIKVKRETKKMKWVLLMWRFWSPVFLHTHTHTHTILSLDGNTCQTHFYAVFWSLLCAAHLYTSLLPCKTLHTSIQWPLMSRLRLWYLNSMSLNLLIQVYLILFCFLSNWEPGQFRMMPPQMSRSSLFNLNFTLCQTERSSRCQPSCQNPYTCIFNVLLLLW